MFEPLKFDCICWLDLVGISPYAKTYKNVLSGSKSYGWFRLLTTDRRTQVDYRAHSERQPYGQLVDFSVGRAITLLTYIPVQVTLVLWHNCTLSRQTVINVDD